MTEPIASVAPSAFRSIPVYDSESLLRERVAKLKADNHERGEECRFLRERVNDLKLEVARLRRKGNAKHE